MDAAAQKEWGHSFAVLLLRALPQADTLEEAIEAVDAAMAMTNGVVPPPDTRNSEYLTAAFSFDIFNRRAQGVLNKTVAGMKELSAAARRELKAAIKLDEPGEMGQAIIQFVQHYRTQLGELLGATNLSALLAGAREVADKLPPVPLPGLGQPPPPSLPPDAAAGLLGRLEGMSAMDRADAIYGMPADWQQWLNRALAIGTAPPLPPFTPPSPPAESPGAIHFPTIEEAVKDLSSRNVVSRDQYDRLDAATRQKAFTVAGEVSQETLTKIRDALAEVVAEGADVEAFRAKILERVEPDTFLSPAHLDVVARSNIQAAFSDGQMAVLNTPFVRSGYPYASVHPIHDDRARHDHLEVEKIGIQGTNVFRVDDPVFETFRGPWSYGCRCGWTPMSVKFAAEKGIAEAQKWLSDGVEPSPPAFVPFPSFRPPPEFDRALAGAPLSIRLSMLPMDLDAAFGMVGDEWHGPKPPGPPENWTQMTPGPRGGKRWKYSGQAPRGRPPKADPGPIKQKIANLIGGQEPITPQHVQAVAAELMKMTVADLRVLKKELEVKASGLKPEFVRKIAERALGKKPTETKPPVGPQPVQPTPEVKPPEPPKPTRTPPGQPFMPGKPIQERLAAYTEADEDVAKLSTLGAAFEARKAAWVKAIGEQEQLWAGSVLAVHERKAMMKAKGAKAPETKELDKKVRATAKAYRQMLARTEEMKVQMGNWHEDYVNGTAQILKAQTPTPLPVEHLTQSPDILGRFNQGAAWLSGVFEGGPQAFQGKIRVREFSLSEVAAKERANCDGTPASYGGDSMIALGEWDGVGTAVHEIGHSLENHSPGLSDVAREFLKYRLKGEAPQQLNKVLGPTYKDYEVGAKDEFDKAFGEHGWYVGKIYGHGSTEVTSMGIQRMYDDPVSFCQKDPEYAKFIIGVLRGHLR